MQWRGRMTGKGDAAPVISGMATCLAADAK
jgi:hypothetical protein